MALVAVGPVGVAGVSVVLGNDARLARQLGWGLVLGGGVVTRVRSLRHALTKGDGSWSHARRAERPLLSSGYVNFHDASSRESPSANTPAFTASTASAVREVTFNLRIAARSC